MYQANVKTIITSSPLEATTMMGRKPIMAIIAIKATNLNTKPLCSNASLIVCQNEAVKELLHSLARF
ncbi:hypothetical protein D3C85_961410 [compost metagenome]